MAPELPASHGMTAMTTRRTQRLPASEVRERLADIVTEVAYRGLRVVLQRHGKDVAALISVEDLERLVAFERKTGRGSTPVARSAPTKGRGSSSP